MLNFMCDVFRGEKTAVLVLACRLCSFAQVCGLVGVVSGSWENSGRDDGHNPSWPLCVWKPGKLCVWPGVGGVSARCPERTDRVGLQTSEEAERVKRDSRLCYCVGAFNVSVVRNIYFFPTNACSKTCFWHICNLTAETSARGFWLVWCTADDVNKCRWSQIPDS